MKIKNKEQFEEELWKQTFVIISDIDLKDIVLSPGNMLLMPNSIPEPTLSIEWELFEEMNELEFIKFCNKNSIDYKDFV